MKLNFCFKILLPLFVAFSSSLIFAIGGAGPLDKTKFTTTNVKNETPPFIADIGIEEHLGEQVDLSLPFVDEHGQNVQLGKYFNKNVPVYMVLIYYDCPTLCSTHLNTIVTTLKSFEWQIGKEFEFVVVSFDSKEGSKLAAEKKAMYLDMYGKKNSGERWHFLTGNQASIDKLTSQIGFKYAWNPNENQWAHGAASYVLTPEGKISYYHYGLNIVPKVFRLSLVEASNHKIGTIMDRLVLMCLQYDPNKKTYSFYAYNLMRVAAIIMILILGVFFFRFWRGQLKAQA
jgi:protein SCO1